MRKRLEYEFGTVDVYGKYVLVVMKEGITVKPEYNDDLIAVAETYFPDQIFGYITYRKNSYAVNPQVYVETSKIDNLAAFAIVVTSEETPQPIEVERRFLKKPMQIFNSLNVAKDWISACIQEKEALK